MKPTVLVTRLLPAPALDRLNAACTVSLNEENRPLSRQELLQSIRNVDALLCLLTDSIDGPVMDAAGTNLKVIANYAVGYNNIDVPAATARKLPVTNTPGVLTDATADLTWTLILDTVRRVTEGDRAMRQGTFTGWFPLYMLGGEVSGATLGLYGFGRIGQAVARRARGFGMRVLYHQRHRVPASVEQDLQAAYADFSTLLAESDILSIHAPLTPETTHRFGAKEFSSMKRTAYLVNTSRGALVNEADLVQALTQRHIAGAGLDVYEREPAMEPGLAQLEHVVLAPHLGSATLATRTTMAHLAVDNVLAALQKRQPPNCVNPEVF